MFDLLEESVVASTQIHSLTGSVSAHSESHATDVLPTASSPTDKLALDSAIASALSIEQALPLPNLRAAQISEISHDSLSAASAAQRTILEADQLGLDQAALNNASGTFVVSEQGQVEVDFLFDGGQYAGELAIFSLAGMGGLGKAAFEKEAITRALSGTENGQVVISDRAEGAQFSGRLGERDRNQGRAANTQKLTLTAGAYFAFMLMPNNTIAAVANGETANAPLFSISALNPEGKAQMAQASDGIFAVEDMLVGKGDDDFNDLIFQVKGATSNLKNLSQLVASHKNWLTNPTAQTFLLNPQSTPSPKPIATNSATSGTEESGSASASAGSSGTNESSSEGSNSNGSSTSGSGDNSSGSDGSSENNSGSGDSTSSTGANVITDISDVVHKFTESSNEAQIIASGANSITIGSQTIYIGTNQVSGNNQNPIIRSFDATGSSKNWTRTDLETTGTDGRGLGLVWTGTALYGVFSVDGIQGQPAEDFRRATGDAQQNWLKSFGSGEGKIAVIGQLDPLTGALLKAAYLSAVKQDGKTNSLLVTDMTVNNTGNLIISAKSYFSPRRPNGSAMTRDSELTASSPFNYTVEMTADLTKVVSTAAVGWR
ncbi:MAG: DUF4114 domain-containing protein [Cyanobacteria bacterium J06621_11]